MGNSNSENLYKEQIISLLKTEINNLSRSIKKYLSNRVINDYKKEILNYIDSEFKKKIIDIENILNQKNINLNEKQDKINIEHKKIEDISPEKDEIKKDVKKYEIKKYDCFERKDIQNKNLAITRDFESRYSDYINDEDHIENQSIADFLLEIAYISRLSLKESNKYLQLLYQKYNEENKNTKDKGDTIITLDQFKKEFSSWVKQNDDKVDCYLNDYLNKSDLSFIEKIKDTETKNYFFKLFKDLIILYYQCELSIPKVEVSFDVDKKYIFDGKKMIDILNKGNHRKVNFVFFPSLYSNGTYIQNGKQWVFTYINNPKKHTFCFENLNFGVTLDEKNKFSIPKLSDKLKLEVKSVNYLVPQLNYKISNKIKKEYIFNIKKKNDNKIISKVTENENIEIDENSEFIGCEFILMGEKICEYKNKLK